MTTLNILWWSMPPLTPATWAAMLYAGLLVSFFALGCSAMFDDGYDD